MSCCALQGLLLWPVWRLAMAEGWLLTRITGGLLQLTRQYPDMRFGQIVSNVAGGDPFYLSDEQLAHRIEMAMEHGIEAVKGGQ